MKARVFLSLALALPARPQFHRADDARHAGRHRPAAGTVVIEDSAAGAR